MTYDSSGYEQARKQREAVRAAERAAAPKECPYCKKTINQHLSEWDDRIRQHCGGETCRAAAYRANKAERQRRRREQVDVQVQEYAARLDPRFQSAFLDAKKQLFHFADGPQLMAQLMQIIEARACKHDRIQVLLDAVAAEKRRANDAEAYASQLETLYKERIAALLSEIEVYQTLEGTIHGIARRQLAQQPEPEQGLPSLALVSEKHQSDAYSEGEEDGDDEGEEE